MPFLADFWVFEEGGTHNTIGYVLFALVLIRLLWGLTGTKYARFNAFWPSLSEIKAHAKGFFTGGYNEPHLSHNPLGAVMAINLLATLALISITGIMMESYAFGDVDFIEGVHTLLADYAIVCVVLHIAGALFESRRSKSKLVRAMITGRKDIIDHGS